MVRGGKRAATPEDDVDDGFEDVADTSVCIGAALTQIGEKSKATRIAGWNALTKYLRFWQEPEELELYRMTLLESACKGLKKGTLDERASALTVMALLFVHWGLEELEPVWDEYSPAVLAVVAEGGSAAAYAARSLGAMTLLAVEDQVKALELLAAMTATMQRPTSVSLRVAVVQCWTVVTTIVDSVALVRQEFLSTVPLLQSMLDAPDVEVRIAAGEALAVLFAAKDEAEVNEPEDEIATLTSVIDSMEIADRLTEISKDSSKYVSKKDRALQRSNFREFAQAIEEGQAPEEKLKIGRQTLTLDTWPALVQLDRMRDLLAGGLQHHLSFNPVMQEMFGVSSDALAPAPRSRHSAALRRKGYAEADRARNQDVGKDRDRKNTVMQAVLYDSS